MDDNQQKSLKRLYGRIYQRQRRGGLKKHAYLLDDGTRYIDIHPPSKIEKQKQKCHVCDTMIYEGNLWRHEKSVLHCYLAEKQSHDENKNI
jgi:hypothetical protein